MELWEAILRGLKLKPATGEPAPTGPKPVDFTEPSSARPRGTTDGSKIEWMPQGTTDGARINPMPRFRQLRQRVAEIMSTWPNTKAARERPIGVAEYIGRDGTHIQLQAATGTEELLSNKGLTVDGDSPSPDPASTTIKPENVVEKLGIEEEGVHAYSAPHDADFKMLADLDHRLPPGAKGQLYMFIDHKAGDGPCTACAHAVEQFHDRHPGVRIMTNARGHVGLLEAK